MMMKQNEKQKQICIPNATPVLRIVPALAEEVGFNESVVLLQLDYLIAISKHYHDGKHWTYQSITDLEKIFPWWSAATINRAIKSLEEQNLIVTGNYNKHRYDKTRWFALSPEGFKKVKSVYLVDVDSNQNDSNQNDTGSNQNETTIPEITPEITTPPMPVEAEPSSTGVVQESFLAEEDDKTLAKIEPSAKEKPTRKRTTRKKKEPKPPTHPLYHDFHSALAILCNIDLSIKGNIGYVGRVTNEILESDQNYTLADLQSFHDWWYSWPERTDAPGLQTVKRRLPEARAWQARQKHQPEQIENGKRVLVIGTVS